MPPEEEQTQQLSSAALGEATRGPGAGVDCAPVAADGSVPVPPDPLASTLSMRPEAAAGVAAGAGAGTPSSRRPAGVGRELGAVRLLREIGRGATGSVFLGHHTVLGRDVAVKFLVNVRSSPQDPMGLKRFLDEARAAAAVRHPHLTQIYHADVDDTDGTPYLVLEYVRGPTLRQLLDQAGPLDLAAAVAVVADAAAAVHELHAQGLVHRDIKPSNVLLDENGHVFVTDFGLAVRQSHSPGGSGPAGHGGSSTDFAGTPAYMAPEMFDGRMSPRSDVYALGVMTFQLLTGSVPFSGPFDELRDRHAREPLPSDALRGRNVPAEVVEVLERCTNKQPMFRYKTPTDLARALKHAAGCAEAELSKARKRLCDCIAGRHQSADVPSSEPLAGSSGQGEDDDRPGSTSYPDMLSRFATIRRERRTQSPGDGDGSSASHAPPIFRALPIETEAVPVAPAVGPALTPPTEPTAPVPAVVPGPILAASVLGILYGSLLAAWVFGEAVGIAATAVPALGPRTASAPLSIAMWRVLISATSLVLSIVLVAASAGCFRMRPWARRLMVRYAAVDLSFQFLVLLTVFAWAGPATVNALTTGGPVLSPSEHTAIELSVYVAWLVRWLALSIFPAIILALLTRRGVRLAFPERPNS